MGEFYKFKTVERPEAPQVIADSDISRLMADELAAKIFDITKRVNTLGEFGGKEYNEADHFRLRDKISLILDSEKDLVGARDYLLDIAAAGVLADLSNSYQIAIAEALSRAELDAEKIYSVRDWRHEMEIFDQTENEINDSTSLKSSSSSSFVSRGKPQK